MDRPGVPLADYDDDLIQWIDQQVTLLRAGDFERLDIEHLVKEFEEMVGRNQRELCGRLTVPIMHLLKCRYAPRRKSTSWLATINEQRRAIEPLLERSPSLRSAVERMARQEYPHAVRSAAIETRLPKCAFPSESPFTPAQLLDNDFVP
ncbi:DUF29 domain-containing protein [Massilia pseudoviolaceinigra]|uniref:DUF29 domain-containing protein n=1 Tax=Massilia pseudoviolaceinigra TaxID=3057165 RepID=UPI002796DFB3|nr:DUF29 domain-containing protein [Massilia sp. CCM 9206]MDQ1925065.1 DUF29 domain-containing protein [Massilia sp. CCM 9206]